MSLINDALKRAKQAQGQTAPPIAAGPQLRPVEPVVAASHASRLAMPGITIAVIGIALFLAWRLVHTNSSVRPGVVVPQVPAVANAAPASQPPPIAQHAPARIVEATATVQPSSPPATILAMPAEAGSSIFKTVAPAPGAAATNVAATIVPTNTSAEPEKPAPPKLQGIMYQPGRPAAMISGKMVFIGDKLGAWRVTAIDQESATLTSAGQTNILTLPQ